MRMLKQSLLSMVLVLVALLGLNVIRLGRTPAQAGPQGEGPEPIRNGDVDCDGQINITDPIVTLNWLFGDGPEPCAIAQTDTCCTELRAEVAALRATVGSLVARIPGPSDIVTFRKTLHFSSNETRTLVDVPDDRSFIVTSFSTSIGGNAHTLVSLSEGKSTPVTPGFPDQSWSSGFAFPRGADVGLNWAGGDENLEIYLNGYLLGE